MEKRISIEVSKSIGKISAKITGPKIPAGVLVLAHGAGAGMDHPFMESLAEELEAKKITTVRYNFPYMEGKRARPDPPAIATKTVACVVEKTQMLFPKIPLFVAGKSFGGRMSSQWVSKEKPEGIMGIAFYGFPLHPPGSPSAERADHLFSIDIPILFLQGTRDTLANLELLTGVCKKIPMSTLVTFENADHSFRAGKENLIPKLVAVTVRWMEGVI